MLQYIYATGGVAKSLWILSRSAVSFQTRLTSVDLIMSESRHTEGPVGTALRRAFKRTLFRTVLSASDTHYGGHTLVQKNVLIRLFL